jgi:hypothetical protein
LFQPGTATRDAGLHWVAWDRQPTIHHPARQLSDDNQQQPIDAFRLLQVRAGQLEHFRFLISEQFSQEAVFIVPDQIKRRLSKHS